MLLLVQAKECLCFFSKLSKYLHLIICISKVLALRSFSVAVEIDDLYWNSLEDYILKWYPTVEEENDRLKELAKRASKITGS